MKQEIRNAILQTLVISNKQSIDIAVEKIFKIILPEVECAWWDGNYQYHECKSDGETKTDCKNYLETLN